MLRTALTVGVPIGTLILGWVLNEISHKRRVEDQARLDKKREHRAAQSVALLDLQGQAVEYHEIAGRLLWAAFCADSVVEGDDDLDSQRDELDDLLETKTMELFASRVRVDDLRIRSYVDYLEEMGRQFTSFAGVALIGDPDSLPDLDVLRDQARQLEVILMGLINYIGARLLELVGVEDPETAPYSGQ